MPEQDALDIAWILIAAALVLLMQAGFTAVESGLVRTKNSINVASKNFADSVSRPRSSGSSDSR